jgi:hypothetical protein
LTVGSAHFVGYTELKTALGCLVIGESADVWDVDVIVVRSALAQKKGDSLLDCRP